MSTKIPANLLYTKEHEWALIEGDVATIGVTDFAQGALGDLVFLELPEVGRTLNEGQTFGVLESIKSVSDLYSPVSGTVVESNKDLEGTPDAVNKDAYSSWMIKVRLSNKAELNTLLTPAAYETLCASAH